MLALLLSTALADELGTVDVIEGNNVVSRVLPAWPADVPVKVRSSTCTAVVTVAESGAPTDVSVTRDVDCGEAFAAASEAALRQWQWGAGADDRKGHITVVFLAPKPGDVGTGEPAALKAVDLRAKKWVGPVYPSDAVGHFSEVKCRVATSISVAGFPLAVAVDGCPLDFHASVGDAMRKWRWPADGEERARETVVLVKFVQR